MKLAEVMGALKKAGDAQTRKTYVRHGAPADVYGVKFAELYKLQKKIKTDHDLAAELWKTSNAEAMYVALMVADPAKLTRAEATAWVKQIRWRGYAFYVGMLVARSPHAKALMDAWMASPKEHVAECGFYVMTYRLREAPETVTDAECEAVLADIEKRIHGAVIAIGGFKPSMKAKAIAAAKRIGMVEIDHGDTDCKTPDAVSYIEKTAKRRKA
jgi:3-methyladenine DNA glycosylase AlkD